ncbi:MAG: nucleotidyltransferase family protein [Chloroflexi bacterium]|nr:nucleotidyltransferase family protein [Chloroflexota bacterium]
MASDIEKYFVRESTSIRDAIAQADVNRRGIVLVVDDARRLLGTVTDGDVRRAILANINLDNPVSDLLAPKSGSPEAQPITAPANSDRNSMLSILKEHSILHLPLVDDENRVVSMVRLDEFVTPEPLPLQALIMAGGLGTRLRPLTDDLPKPMLPVGDQPLLEITVKQLQAAGIRRVNMALHHKPEKITEYFGDGEDYGLEINYLNEDQPLGTAGALGLMDSHQDTMLVINGDILTQIDYRAMLEYHTDNNADFTMAVLRYDLQVPYGVIECDGPIVKGVTEKPVLNFFVNAGIYLLEPSAHGFIPKGERTDMTELIQNLVDQGRTVAAFPVREYWLDIGQASDYRQAQEDILQEDFLLKRVLP